MELGVFKPSQSEFSCCLIRWSIWYARDVNAKRCRRRSTSASCCQNRERGRRGRGCRRPRPSRQFSVKLAANLYDIGDAEENRKKADWNESLILHRRSNLRVSRNLWQSPFGRGFLCNRDEKNRMWFPRIMNRFKITIIGLKYIFFDKEYQFINQWSVPRLNFWRIVSALLCIWNFLSLRKAQLYFGQHKQIHFEKLEGKCTMRFNARKKCVPSLLWTWSNVAGTMRLQFICSDTQRWMMQRWSTIWAMVVPLSNRAPKALKKCWNLPSYS